MGKKRLVRSYRNEPVIGYMCKTDFDFELGAAVGGNRVYPSIEDLKNHSRCVNTCCGIVKVSVTCLEVVEDGEDG